MKLKKQPQIQSITDKFYIMLGVMLVALTFSTLAKEITPANERPLLEDDDIVLMTKTGVNKSLCPRDQNLRYEHTLILIDATTTINPLILSEIKRAFLSESKMRDAYPYHKFTIMRLVDKPPQQNQPIFSMCRPRTGDKGSRYRPDNTTTWMGPSLNDYRALFEGFFMKELNKAMKIENINVGMAIGGSPIIEQIVQLERNGDLDFHSDSGYQYRKLILVSDLAQNTDRFNLLDPRKVNNKTRTPLCDQKKFKRKCPTYEQFTQLDEIQFWIEEYREEPLGENLDLHIFYLNARDPNLTEGVEQLWRSYFKDIGFTGKYRRTLQSDIQ